LAGYAKGILLAVIASLAIVILMNVAFFFPWYITLVETSFEVAQVVANENYLPYDTHEDICEELRNKPIFKENPESIEIEVTHSNGNNAIERYPGKTADDYYDSSAKPYVQRGNVVKVTVRATYPFRMQFAGKDITAANITIPFTIETITLKHYKDLDYYID